MWLYAQDGRIDMIIFWLFIIGMTFLALGILLFPLLGKQRNVIAIIGIILGLPILAISLYLKLGAYQAVLKQQEIAEQYESVNAEIKKLGSLQNIVLTLKQKVEANPDARGFMLLGHLYLKTQQFQEASNAFAKANQLNPHQPEILVGYAQSLYFTHKMTLTQQAKALLDETLKLEPEQPDAINLLAIAAYQRGDYVVAIHYWEQLLPLFQQDSTEQQKLLEMIATAQKSMKSVIKLTVDVTLAASLKKQINPNDTVFIYAQAITGSSMPLAIVRKQVRDLPITVTLDQTMAMLPTNTLANYEEVRIVARISKSGQAIAAVGDLEGSSPPIHVKHPPAKIAIVINKKR